MRHYFVVYKLHEQPGVAHFEVDALNKASAREAFLNSGIKHDYIIKVIL